MAQNNSRDGRTTPVENSNEIEAIIISGSMPISEVLTRLGRHGCQDITNQLDLLKFSQAAVSTGGFGDVYHGALQDGTRVGVKCLRLLVGVDDDSVKNQLKRAARELYVWSKCKHPNILELFGVARYDNRVAMVSPWMVNGNLPWYLTRYPDADRLHLCAQIADATSFLRDNGVVHGDIKGANILISQDHIPKLTDFGSSAINKCTLEFTSTTGSPQMTLRWTAPEIFLGETKHTFEGDVYALGMTILEAFTGSAPYNGLLDVAVMRSLMQRVHPVRPEKQLPIGNQSADLLWTLMTHCWDSEPNKRPFALDVRDAIQAIIAARPAACQPNPSSKSPEVQKAASGIMLSIDMSPQQIFQWLIAYGSTDITHKIGKSVVSWLPKWEDVSFGRGYGTEEGTTRLCDGTKVTLRRATKSRIYNYHGANESDLPTLSVQVADAIVYLHRKRITHGDVNTYNIHISPDYIPQLRGFHNACAHDAPLRFPNGKGVESDGYHALALTFLAPEPAYGGSIQASAFEVDVFELGETILDVMTWGQSVSLGKLDQRPEDYIPTDSDDGDRLWSLLQECLTHRPEVRPWATDVQYIMTTITDEGLQKRGSKGKPPRS
ncbi:unnamed protein product [Rhizoctonia solani]|uniref:Protein kinase domain-containing protein n=1 Tax=Rhizoctonia solani TaxID=456999 RepID=A0A8H3B9A1_9AGAM|nr:unnamed protein product [Rhizoctonia solani]